MLKSAIDKLNDRRTSGGHRSPPERLERTLDNQLTALHEIDELTREVEQRMARLGLSTSK
jgi:hypothetical protein